jgi:hypothetical protein
VITCCSKEVRRFRVTYRFHLQGQRVRQEINTNQSGRSIFAGGLGYSSTCRTLRGQFVKAKPSNISQNRYRILSPPNMGPIQILVLPKMSSDSAATTWFRTTLLSSVRWRRKANTKRFLIMSINLLRQHIHTDTLFLDILHRPLHYLKTPQGGDRIVSETSCFLNKKNEG